MACMLGNTSEFPTRTLNFQSQAPPFLPTVTPTAQSFLLPLPQSVYSSQDDSQGQTPTPPMHEHSQSRRQAFRQVWGQGDLGKWLSLL